jgi:hypothetical protein
MKKFLLFFGIIFIINANFAQTIDIYPAVGNTPISDTLMNHQFETLTQDLILNLHDGVYAETIDLSQIYTNASGRILIQSVSGDASTVSIGDGIITGNVITIAQPFIIIKNISVQSNNSSAIFFDFMQGSVEDVLIDSCILKNNIMDNSNPVVYLDNYKTSASGYVFSNNIIENGRIGIFVMTMSNGSSEVEIVNNQFHGQYDGAIEVSGVENLLVHNNNIELGIYNYDSYSKHIGINLSSVEANPSLGLMRCEISANTIFSTNDSVRYNAINIDNCYGSGKFYVKNNFIDIENTDSIVIGIKVAYSDSIKVLHNTIKLTSPKATGFLYEYASKAIFHLFFKNNLIYSSNIVFDATMTFSIPNTDFDNNGYYCPIQDDAFYLEGVQYDLTNWSNTLNLDNNSFFVDPLFGTLNDSKFNNQIYDNVGPKLPEVNFDIDGVGRNSAMCDIGAKEQLFLSLGNDTTICYGENLLLFAPIGMFSYQWNTSETNQSITVNTSGNYSVTVQETDGGPIAIDSIIVNVNTEIITTLTNITNPVCFGYNTGLIELNTTGGNSPYSYSWQGAFLDTNKIENLSAGDYYLTIIDNFNCTLDTFFTVTEPDSIQFSFNSPNFCGGCTGFIVPTINGGTAPYTYSWSSGITDSIAYDLCSGTYTLTVIDNNLCVNLDSYSITESGLAYISGTLSYIGGNVAENDGKVELYKYFVDGASQLELADENILGTSGAFEFTAVEPESFYLRGLVTSNNSNYDNVYTSYYLDGGDTTAWTGATLVSVECEDTLVNLDFVMYETTSAVTGPGIFSGTVTYRDLTKSAGEPVPGAEVFVEQEPNDEPIANTETDTAGTWTIEDIPTGTGYHIYIDIPGMPLLSTYQELIVEAGDTTNSDLNFFVDTLTGGGIYIDSATYVINVNSEEIEIKSYPNPVNNYFTIETELNKSIFISYSILDINGREIVKTNPKLYQEKYNEQIDMSSYKNGVYFIKLKLDNAFYIKKLIKQ